MSVLAIARLEWRRLFVRPLGWILGALALAELGWRFTLLLGHFLDVQIRLAAAPGGPGYTDLVGVPLFSSMLTGGFLPFGVAELALLLAPLLSMATLAGERSAGTLPLLLSTGASGAQIVLGKFLAVLAWLLVWLALVAAMPLCLAQGIHLDAGKLAAAVLGTALLLSALAAIGIAASSFASHPAVAAAAALVVTLALWSVNLGAQAAGANGGVIDWLAMTTHLEALLRGLVSSKDVVYFVLVTGVSLALAAHRVARERSRP